MAECSASLWMLILAILSIILIQAKFLIGSKMGVLYHATSSIPKASLWPCLNLFLQIKAKRKFVPPLKEQLIAQLSLRKCQLIWQEDREGSTSSAEARSKMMVALINPINHLKCPKTTAAFFLFKIIPTTSLGSRLIGLFHRAQCSKLLNRDRLKREKTCWVEIRHRKYSHRVSLRQ